MQSYAAPEAPMIVQQNQPNYSFSSPGGYAASSPAGYAVSSPGAIAVSSPGGVAVSSPEAIAVSGPGQSYSSFGGGGPMMGGAISAYDPYLNGNPMSMTYRNKRT